MVAVTAVNGLERMGQAEEGAEGRCLRGDDRSTGHMSMGSREPGGSRDGLDGRGGAMDVGAGPHLQVVVCAAQAEDLSPRRGRLGSARRPTMTSRARPEQQRPAR